MSSLVACSRGPPGSFRRQPAAVTAVVAMPVARRERGPICLSRLCVCVLWMLYRGGLLAGWLGEISLRARRGIIRLESLKSSLTMPCPLSL